MIKICWGSGQVQIVFIYELQYWEAGYMNRIFGSAATNKFPGRRERNARSTRTTNLHRGVDTLFLNEMPRAYTQQEFRVVDIAELPIKRTNGSSP